MRSRDDLKPGKRLFLRVAEPAFQRVLGGLLEEWGYRILETPEEGGVALVQDGRDLPAGCEVIRLGGSEYLGRNRLHLPVSLEDLWCCLESRFHKPPRNHIRLAMEAPATVGCRACRFETTVVSLSDLGARFRIGRELAEAEEIRLCLELDRPWELAGRVIYCLCRGEGTDREEWEVGVIFDRLEHTERRELRQEIIARYLARVRSRLPADDFCTGLEGLNVAGSVLQRLGCL